MTTLEKAVFIIALIVICNSAFAQSTTIRIRFENWKTGKPLSVKYMQVGGGGYDLKDYRVEKVEKTAIVVTFKDKKTFAFRNEGYYRCDAKQQTAPTEQFDLAEIAEHGVISTNVCGHLDDNPVKGELIIYSRHAHFWEAVGNLRGLFLCA